MLFNLFFEKISVWISIRDVYAFLLFYTHTHTHGCMQVCIYVCIHAYIYTCIDAMCVFVCIRFGNGGIATFFQYLHCLRRIFWGRLSKAECPSCPNRHLHLSRIILFHGCTGSQWWLEINKITWTMVMLIYKSTCEGKTTIMKDINIHTTMCALTPSLSLIFLYIYRCIYICIHTHIYCIIFDYLSLCICIHTNTHTHVCARLFLCVFVCIVVIKMHKFWKNMKFFLF